MSEEREKKLSEYYSWSHPFGVAVYNISKEYNIGSLLRTAHCAKVKGFYLIGDKSYNTYAAATSEKWTNITFFEDLKKFLTYTETTDYNLVLVEQATNSDSLFEFKFPKNPLFLLGKEKGGLPSEIINKNYPTVEIPQYGLVHSLNLSCSGSIVIYHYLYTLYKDKLKTKKSKTYSERN